VRIEIPPALDDDVFDAAGDVELAIDTIRAIAGIDPGKFSGGFCGATDNRFSLGSVTAWPSDWIVT
jgi:hypothetical protein